MTDALTDKDRLLEWQRTQNPSLFADLVIRYQPVVMSVVNRYSKTGVNPAALHAQATSQLIKAFKSYDPERGTQPTTHIWNNLQKVQRMATESLISGHIPENRNLKMATFKTTVDNLKDRLGYEPNIDQMADELSWSRKEVARMNSELAGEVPASSAEFDFYGNSTSSERKEKQLADYMYHGLEGKDKVIFEHTFGYAGKPILTNRDIAKKLNVNEMWVNRAKNRMAEKIKEAM